MKQRVLWSSLAALAFGAPLLADYLEELAPAVTASIHDEPIDGLGDSVDTAVNLGRITLSPTAEDRAVHEYDVTGVQTFDVSGAWIYGRVLATDMTDVGVRTFEFLIYDANGVAEASDFEVAGTVVGTAQYHPPGEAYFDYNIDVGDEVIDLFDAGVTHIGIRLRCTSGASPGDELSATQSVLGIEHCLLSGGSTFCHGNSGNCPGGAIGNFGAGCPHIAGPNGAGGASLLGLGNASFGNDSFALTVTAGPSSLGIVIQGANAIAYPNGNASVPGSAGLFCVAPQLRGNIEFTDLGAGSDEALIDDFQGLPFGATAQPAGAPTYYQFWFRDSGNPNAVPGGGAAFNFSNALQVAWF